MFSAALLGQRFDARLRAWKSRPQRSWSHLRELSIRLLTALSRSRARASKGVLLRHCTRDQRTRPRLARSRLARKRWFSVRGGLARNRFARSGLELQRQAVVIGRPIVQTQSVKFFSTTLVYRQLAAKNAKSKL